MSQAQESALVKPFRTVYRIVGAVFDAFYYFFESLLIPTSNSGRLNSRARSGAGGSLGGSSGGSGGGGPRIATLRRTEGNAPNMSVGGCRSCAM